jgi:N-acetylmuramoyl-L-alanine amidase
MAHIALIVGHTPVAPGAVSIGGVSEFAYNSIVADRLEARLTALGYRVSRVARDLPNNLAGLPAKVNATGAQLAIELHFNSAADPAGNGCEMLHWHNSSGGRELADYMQQAVLQAFGLRNRGLKPIGNGGRGDLLLRSTRMPCILTEPFFGSNAGNWNRMKDAHDVLAGAYAHGVVGYAHRKGIAPARPVVVTTTRPDALVQSVVDAWATTGPDPVLHQRAQENLARDWPALAAALQRLATG